MIATGGVIPTADDSASCSEVRFSKVVEERRAEYVPVNAPSAIISGPSSLRVKRQKVTRTPVKLPRRLEIVSPPEMPQNGFAVEDPIFGAALQRHRSLGTSKRNGRDRRAAPVLQTGLH